MRSRDIVDLVLLAAIWGGSFLLMKLGVPEFGAVPLMFLRTALALLLLVPLLAWQGGFVSMRANAGRIFVMGVLNSALPFVLFAFAMVSIPAGLGAILNATAPFWAALVAYGWRGETLDRWQVAGLIIGFSGVLLLVWDKISFAAGGSGWAVIACLLATLCYGIGSNYTRRYLGKVDALANATGSQLAAALVLLPVAVPLWPPAMPGPMAWLSLLALALVCTGYAYVVYFRLIRNVGPTRAITVTFLVPVFGVFWGAVFLGERPTLGMVGAGLVILIGTALITGLIKPGRDALN